MMYYDQVLFSLDGGKKAELTTYISLLKTYKKRTFFHCPIKIVFIESVQWGVEHT